jgi:hypothetical protein
MSHSIKVPYKLREFIFNDNHNIIQIKGNVINSKDLFTRNSHLFACCLTYNNFIIFLENTKNQNDTLHNLDMNFFDNLSQHKNKIIFFGNFNSKGFFNPIGFVYLYANKKLGLYVKKAIIRNFKEKGIKLLSDTTSSIDYTIFLFSTETTPLN